MAKKAMLLVVLSVLVAYSAVNHPYPQRKNYGNGTINATSSRASAELKGKFENFVRDFYVEGNCNGTNDCARIKFDSPNEGQTVSEGIGYAMIMMVYFSDNTKSYKSEFDKLWTYYKKFSNDNGVMNWKINGFSDVAGRNGATDAELDAAFALAMASYQFGDTAHYNTEARNLIAKIKQHEVSADGLLKPGDAWDADRNPSYVSPAAFEIFKGLGTESDWVTALTRNYTFLKANQNGTTGLPSGWANTDGSRKTCTNNCGITTIAYDQDAVRAPWRWAWANAWYGHADAKTLLGKLGSWVNGKEPGDVKGPINDQTGAWGTDASSGYIGSLMCALTANSEYQPKLNSYWSTLVGQAGESYFNQALQVLFGLLVTGNMPNLKACAAGSCGTDMGESGYSGGKTSIDKFDLAESEDNDDRGFARTWEPWIAYTDIENGKEDPACTFDPRNGPGASTISNTKFTSKDENDNCKDVTSYTVVIKEDGEWAARIPHYELAKFKIVNGDTVPKPYNRYAPFVALGLLAKNNGIDYDLANCSGFSYEYKGSAHNFKAQSKEIPDCEGSDHVTTISTAATNWTEVEIDFAELKQPTWATTKKPTFDPAQVEGFIWELKGHDDGPPFAPGKEKAGISADIGSLAIRNFKCLGEMPTEATRGASKCGESSPIKSSQFAKAKMMQPIKNGVSLQVANNATLEVYSLKGNLLQKRTFANGTWSVQLSDLPKGLYIVKTQSGSHREILQVPVR
jgi:endo-1,4-beta-D-glucanase Y